MMRPLLSLTWVETGSAPTTFLASIKLGCEQDVVLARQRGRQIAELLEYDQQNQVRIATAVSEVAREGLQNGDVAVLEFGLSNPPEMLLIRLICPSSRDADEAPQRNLALSDGLVMARRILGHFQTEDRDNRSVYLFGRTLPAGVAKRDATFFRNLETAVGKTQIRSLYQEYQAHNQELLETLNELRRQRLELAKVNRELEETNRGVVALYSELEEKAESLRKANEQRSRFYSSISHEFRTPVTSILSLAQILINRLDGELTDEQARQVSLIRQCGENLLDWVNDLLDLARADAGRLELRITHFKLVDLLSGLRGVMRPLSNNDAVELIVDCPPEAADIELQTDEVKVSQILRNFVSNALKFTARGEVRVFPEIESVSDGQLTLVVRDTGIGIAPEDQERVFEEFVQIDSLMQRKTRGTGLGLPLSRRLAELMGGSISLTSVVGEGTAFRLVLPLIANQLVTVHSPSSAQSEVSEPVSESTQEAPRVLLIDDDMACRYLLGQVLEQLGMQISEAETGTEGLDLASRLHPQAIFLDLMMPDLHGTEVLDALKKSISTRNIPVVIYSSQPGDITDYPQWQSLVAAVLEKPTGSDGPPRGEIEQALREAGVLPAIPSNESTSAVPS